MFDLGIIDIHEVKRISKGEPMLGIMIFNHDPSEMVKCFMVHAVEKLGTWTVFEVRVRSWK